MATEDKTIYFNFRKLKELRLSMPEVTIGAICRGIGIRRSVYHNYETGKTQPGIHTLIKIARFFEVWVGELLYKEFQ